MGREKYRTWTHNGKKYASKDYPRDGVGWTVFPNDMIELEEGRDLIAMDSSEEIVSINESGGAVADQEPPLDWMDQSWIRVRSSFDPIVSALLEAVRRVQPIWIRYAGGSLGGDRRQILPAIVFRSEEEIYDSWDRIYCIAWCALRQAPRLFRIDRIAEVVSGPVSDRGSFPIYRALGEIERELCESYHLTGEKLKILKFKTDGKGEVLAIP